MNHAYPKIENELPKHATYFVSFWWAIFWKEAIALAAAFGMWRWAESWADGLWWRIGLGVAIGVVLYLFFRELFYATLEKRYLRKNFTMIGVDKDGEFNHQKLDQARTLLWSFLWGHLSLIGWALFVCAAVALFFWISAGVDFGALFFAAVLSLTQPWALVFWAVVFAFYPHYHIWSRPFFNLAGFRLALVEK